MIYIVYTPEYKKYLEKLQNSLIRIGYKHETVPQKEVPNPPKGLKKKKTKTVKGHEYTYKAKSQWKPYFIQDKLKNGDVTYMDCDMIVRKPFSEFFEHDVSVTVHNPPLYERGSFPECTALLNAGIVHIKSNKNGREFMREWIATMQYTTTGSDQEALCIMCQRGFKKYVKEFDSKIYNNCEPENEQGKIWHFPGIRKKLLDNLCAESK